MQVAQNAATPVQPTDINTADTQQEKRFNVILRRNRNTLSQLEQLICLAQNQWSDNTEKVLRKNGDELSLIYVNSDNTVRGGISAKMIDYPDNTMIRYINNGPQTECTTYTQKPFNVNDEIIIQNVTLEELEYVMKILQNQ